MKFCSLPIAVCLLTGGTLLGGDWIRVNSTNFELYTSSSDRRAREILTYFEQVRGLALKRFPNFLQDPLPVRLIAFSSDKEYKPYKLNGFAAAYYLPDHERDYIVMSNVGEDVFPVAAHEYMHLLVKHAKLNLPVWLNEGFADVNCMVQPKGDQLLVGVPFPGRVYELQNNKWMPLEVLTAVQHDSPEYNEKQRVGMLYAESWLLTHMLYLSDAYSPKFPEFVAAIARGSSTADAFKTIYGKSLDDVMKDLRAYMRGGKVNVMVMDVKLDKSVEKPVPQPAPEIDLRLTFALILQRGDKKAEAAAAYQQLEADFPAAWQTHQAIGNRAWEKGDYNAAREHYARAVALSPNDANVYFNYAKLLQGNASDREQLASALGKALELNPALSDARYLLGLTLYNMGRYARAVQELRELKKLTAEQPPHVFLALAYSYQKLKAPDAAKEAALNAKKYATTETDRASADQLLDYLDHVENRVAPALPAASGFEQAPDSDTRPTLRRRADAQDTNLQVRRELRRTVQGTLAQMDCLNGPARLHIDTRSGKVLLMIKDPQSVEIRGNDAGSLEFKCGALNVPVTIEYVPEFDKGAGTAGVVRILEVRK